MVCVYVCVYSHANSWMELEMGSPLFFPPSCHLLYLHAHTHVFVLLRKVPSPCFVLTLHVLWPDTLFCLSAVPCCLQGVRIGYPTTLVLGNPPPFFHMVDLGGFAFKGVKKW